MKTKNLFLAIMVFGATFLVSGCKPDTPPPMNAQGIPKINSKLVGEVQGCELYQVETTHLRANLMYLTKCGNTATVDSKHGKETPLANTTQELTEEQLKVITKMRRAEAMNKLSKEEIELLGLK